MGRKKKTHFWSSPTLQIICNCSAQLPWDNQTSCQEEVKSLSHVRLFATPWTSPSMEFSRQEYWSGLPFPSPGDLPDPGIEPRSPALEADTLTSEPPGKPDNTENILKLYSIVVFENCSTTSYITTAFILSSRQLGLK